jgi:transposase-like protein
MSQRTAESYIVNGTKPRNLPDAEVRPKAHRRTFTVEYKLAILSEADRCREAGEIGALLRREGLYSSNLTSWRRQRDAGELAPGAVKRRGRKANPEAAEAAKLRRENERLRSQLEQAELIIVAQKKLAQALERTLSRENDVPS